MNFINKELMSKELMSEVLNLNITYIERCNNSIVYKISVYDREEEVNIYELAYKCKEWAYKQGFIIDTGFHKNYINQFKANCYGWVSENIDIEKNFNKCTEIEAVFVSCQWILDNKQKGKI